ncbi:MAG: DUF4355 domain-containing protein [Clostridium sp.]|uniref:DUF4355 domain-containing protein n=1 Tax=Clostridium sp. TaxID=1506 RepID=UPI0039E92D30
MSIENFDEVKNYFETNKDSEDVKNFLGGFSSLDVFKEKVNSDSNFKSFMDSEKDKHSSKSLETWKTNNLQKLIDDAVSKANPQETPEQKQVRELKAQLDKMQKDSLHKELTNSAYKLASEKKLPNELVDYFVGQDADSTTNNINKFAEIMALHDEAIRKEFAKDNSYTPPADKGGDLSGLDKLREQIRNGLK